MSNSERRQRGVEKLLEVYCGDVAVLPEGTSAFFDVMVEQLFSEVWTREALSQRDRRLLLLGAIAALGEGMTFAIQTKAAIKNEEMTEEQMREVLIHLAQYVGYPRAAGLLGPMENALAEVRKEKEKKG